MVNYFAAKYGEEQDIQQGEAQASPDKPAVNHFAAKYATPEEEQQMPSQEEQPKQGAFMAGLENFNRSFGKIAEGTIAGISDMLGATDYAARVKQFGKQMDMSAKQAVDDHPVAGTFGKIAGDVATYLPAAIASGGASVPMQAAVAGGTGTAFGLARTPDEGESRLGNAAYEGAVSGVAGGVGGWLGNVLGGGVTRKAGEAVSDMSGKEGTGLLSKMMNPRKAAENTLLNEVKVAPQGVEAALAAGDDAIAAGAKLTPAEQLGTESAKKLVSNIPLNDYGIKKQLMAQDAANAEIGKGMLGKVVDSMVPQGDEAAMATKNALFKQLETVELPKESLTKLSTNPVIKDYAAQVVKSDLLDGVSLNSVGGMNVVRRAIADDMASAGKSGKSLSSIEFNQLKKAKDLLTGELSAASPKNAMGVDAFTEANQIAQGVILKRKTLDDMAKIVQDTKGDSSLSSMYRGLFGNDVKVKDFLSKVESTGGDTKSTESLIKVIGQLSDTSVKKLGSKGVSSEVAGHAGYNSAGLVQEFVTKITTGRYNRELANLLVDNKWQPVVKELVAKQNNMPAFMKTLKEVVQKMKAPDKVIRKAGLLSGAAAIGREGGGMLQQGNN